MSVIEEVPEGKTSEETIIKAQNLSLELLSRLFTYSRQRFIPIAPFTCI